jgi:hypothetical protein
MRMDSSEFEYEKVETIVLRFAPKWRIHSRSTVDISSRSILASGLGSSYVHHTGRLTVSPVRPNREVPTSTYLSDNTAVET